MGGEKVLEESLLPEGVVSNSTYQSSFSVQVLFLLLREDKPSPRREKLLETSFTLTQRFFGVFLVKIP